jgi:hypothetical protein
MPGNESPPDCPAVTSVMKAAPSYPVREAEKYATSGSTTRRSAADQVAKGSEVMQHETKARHPSPAILAGCMVTARLTIPLEVWR